MGVPHRVQLRAHRKHWGNTGEERGWLPALLLTLPRSASFVICLSKTHPFAISVHQLLSSPNSNPRVQSPSVNFSRRLHPSDTREWAIFWLALSLFKENSSDQGLTGCQVLSPLHRQCSASKRQGILETFGRTSSESELSFLLQGSQSFIPWQQCGLSTVLWHKAQAPVSYTCLAARIPHWMKKATRSVNFVPISFSLKCTVQNTFYSNTTRYKIASQYLTEYQRE